jgi:glutamyl-tRNA(Gln) amidotransferase subunit E
VDYSTLGLKVGIEIHQQLSTGKLFCECPSELVDEHHREIIRRLRPTQSEMGEIDKAALEEAERKLQFRYQTVPCSCLVEADEEPPHDANRLAIEVALEMAMLLDMTPVDELHFMRKIVIDGSNTGGFQRTALVATKGHLDIGGKRLGMSLVGLEEDAARKMVEHGSEVTFRLDRLGIPLVEVATSPDIASPEEARVVAARIGALLRATKKVRRGIGTIREDINISISGGARVEIKGAQDLKLVPVYVEEEVKRQLALLEVKDVLRGRGASDAPIEIKDLTALLRGTSCKVLRSAVDAGGRVMAVRLPKFSGTLGRTAEGVTRLGAEMAAHARVAGVKGLFHSDELPGYGITKAETEDIAAELSTGPTDAFVLVADAEGRARAALARAVDRANVGIRSVPEETRDPLPDGHTVYSRPLPGRGRMYPETDVKPIRVDERMLEGVRLNLPELPEDKAARFVKDYGVNKEQAEALLNGAYEDEFELLAGTVGHPQVVARVYLNVFSELEKAGHDTSRVRVEAVKEMLMAMSEGAFAKEAIPDLLSWMLKNDVWDVARASDSLGVESVPVEDVKAVCERVVREREAFIRQRGEGALGPLMGIVMKELRGKVDGKVISEVLSERIRQLLS